MCIIYIAYQSNASVAANKNEVIEAVSAAMLASFFSPVYVPLVADRPELKQIDQILVKQSHAATVTFILEAVKQNADKSTVR